jgi:CDP-paratose 2-epimerase
VRVVTGGAGFVGANLCFGLAGCHPGWRLIAFDNLYRRGSELNLPRLRVAALAGIDGDTEYAARTSLLGAFNCLELARRDTAQLVFLSASRVYPFDKLSALALDLSPSRFELSPARRSRGRRPRGSPRSSRSTVPAPSTVRRNSPQSC